VDLAPPTACLTAPGLEELLEAFQVAFDASLHQSERILDLFDDAFGIVVEHHGHLAGARIDRLEHDPPSIVGIPESDPVDLTIGYLARDLRIPLLLLPATSATQWTCVSSSWVTDSTPSMKRGKSSNWVHWLYAAVIGASTSGFLAVPVGCAHGQWDE
jgi:hypothetical protein